MPWAHFPRWNGIKNPNNLSLIWGDEDNNFSSNLPNSHVHKSAWLDTGSSNSKGRMRHSKRLGWTCPRISRTLGGSPDLLGPSWISSPIICKNINDDDDINKKYQLFRNKCYLWPSPNHDKVSLSTANISSRVTIRRIGDPAGRFGIVRDRLVLHSHFLLKRKFLNWLELYLFIS